MEIFQKKKFLSKNTLIDIRELKNIKKKYNFEILNEFEEPISNINDITKINFLKDNIKYDEKNKNNLNKNIFKNFFKNHTTIRNKKNSSSITLYNDKKKRVGNFLKNFKKKTYLLKMLNFNI